MKTFISVPLGVTYSSETAEIALISIVDDVSTKICAADETADGCKAANGSGIVDPKSDTRYVEFVFRIKNLDVNPVPTLSYRLLLKEEITDIDTGVTIETLNDLVIKPGETVTGSLYGLVPKDLQLTGGVLIIESGITDHSVILLLATSR